MSMNLGVLGFAHGHVNLYCEHWRNDNGSGIHVSRGWDHDSQRLETAAARHGFEPCSSAEELLESEVSAVVIAAETSRHAELAVRAAEAGKAIVLQKPMALSLAEAERIREAVERTGVPFSLAWQMRVDPENLAMRDLLEGGGFGRVLQVRRRHCLPVLQNEGFHRSWHLVPECNRDIFADDAAHAADFIYWLFGMPETVSAELATVFDPRFANDVAVALYRYPDGKIVELSGCFAALAGENTTEIVAENGVILQNYGDAPSTAHKPPGAISLKWFKKGDKTWTISPLPGVSSQSERLAGLAAPLARFLHGEAPPLATAKEGCEVLRMILAGYVASRQGRRIPLNDPEINNV